MISRELLPNLSVNFGAIWGVNFLLLFALNLPLVAAFGGTAACGDKSILRRLADLFI